MLSALFAGLAWQAAIKQGEIAERAMKGSERPWLMVGDPMFRIDAAGIPVNNGTVLEVPIINYGNGPALNVTARFMPGPVEWDDPKECLPRTIEHGDIVNRIVAPGQSIKFSVQLTDNEAPILGRVNYTDRLGDLHSTSFCGDFTVYNGKPTYGGCNACNEAD